MNLLDQIQLGLLKAHKRWSLRGIAVENLQTPIVLLEEFNAHRERDSRFVARLAESIIPEGSAQCLQELLGNGFAAFKKDIDCKLRIFDRRPYQLGGLDAEIDLIVALLARIPEPDVLEIGVANGYSSAFLYRALDILGGTMTAIDLPKYYGQRKMDRIRRFPFGRMRERLAAKGLLQDTGTIGDISPGGIIPDDRYGGWLVPMELRGRVPNRNLFGNAFAVLPDLERTSFDLAVVDAVKDYDARTLLFGMVADRLRPGGVCLLDGYWVNAAFDDFCAARKLPRWTAGRVGLFRVPQEQGK